MRNALVVGVVALLIAGGAAAYFLFNAALPKDVPAPADHAEPAGIQQAASTPTAPVGLPEEESDTAPKIAETGAMDEPVADEDDVEFDNARPIKVYGTVTDAATGAPIAGAMIYTDTYHYMEVSTDVYHFDELDEHPDAGITADELRDLVRDSKPLPKNVQEFMEAPTVLTDDSGAYSVTVDSYMEETVYCRAKGFAAATRETNEQSPESMRVDFQLRPGATITGKVTNAANGEGVADVSVVAMLGSSSLQMPWGAAESDYTPTAKTAADGTYSVEGLAAGQNVVSVVDGVHGWLFDAARAVHLTLTEGEKKDGIDLQVTEGLRAEGTITDEDGQPIVDARVTSIPSSGNPLDFAGYLVKTQTVTSDDDGHYTAIGLRPGKNTISVNHEAYATATGEVTAEQGQAPPHLDFTLERGSEVSGVAKYEDGTFAGSTMLYLTRADAPDDLFDFDFREQHGIEFTDEETGAFTFQHVTAGDYVLGDKAPYDRRPDDAKAPSLTVHVDGKKPVTGLEITLPKEKPEQTRSRGEIAGVVLDREGNPAPDVGVRAVSQGEEGLFDGGWKDPDETTDKEGAFTLDHLYGKVFTVHAASDKGEASQENVKPGDKITLRLGPITSISGVVVDANGDAVPGCKVELNKADTSGEGSMASMMEKMMGSFMPGGGSGETSDDFGQFTFKHIDAGNYIVEAKSAGRGFGASNQVSVTKGSEQSGVRIVLEAGATFTGIVVDGAGTPVQGANVSLVESTGGMMESVMMNLPMGMGPPPAGAATTGPDGTFTINGLKRSTYLLTAKHADFAPYTAKGVDVSNVQSSPYRIALGKGGTARGQYLADGQPKANLMIQLMGPGGMQMAMTDSEGRFEVKGLPAGTYMVNALDIGAMMQNGGDDGIFPNMNYKSITITEGGDVVVPFGGGVAVSGTVPAEHMGKMTLVYLVRKGAPDMPAFENMDTTDPEAMMETGMQMMQYMAGIAEVKADGNFSFTGIDPGEYEVRIYASDFSMEDIDPSEFMDLPLDEIQEHTQAFAPKQVYKQPVTVGDQPMTIAFTIPPAESTP